MSTNTMQEDVAQQVADLFPSVLDIRDESLRSRVIAVWDEAIREGNGGRGWDLAQLRALPFTLKAGEIEMRFVEHLNSCVRQCQSIARVLSETFGDRVPVDTDVLIAGALTADVGKLFEIEVGADGPFQNSFGALVRHPFSGVALGYKHGLPPEVMHIAAAHSFEGDKIERTIECIIFHHADFIDFDIAKLLGARAGSQTGARARS